MGIYGFKTALKNDKINSMTMFQAKVNNALTITVNNIA